MDFTTKDSGERVEFSSGMKRDTEEGKTLYHLLYDGPLLKRWAELLTRGAKKYDEGNWMKASGEEEYKRFRKSAARHFFQWMIGDRDEDHAAAVVFNLNGAEYVRDKIADKPLESSVVMPDGYEVKAKASLNPFSLTMECGPAVPSPEAWDDLVKRVYFSRYAGLTNSVDYPDNSPVSLATQIEHRRQEVSQSFADMAEQQAWYMDAYFTNYCNSARRIGIVVPMTRWERIKFLPRRLWTNTKAFIATTLAAIAWEIDSGAAWSKVMERDEIEDAEEF